MYLDRDAAGKKATEQALTWSENLVDQSYLYEGFKDLNAYLCQQKLQQNEQQSPIKIQRLQH